MVSVAGRVLAQLHPQGGRGSRALESPQAHIPRSSHGRPGVGGAATPGGSSWSSDHGEQQVKNAGGSIRDSAVEGGTLRCARNAITPVCGSKVRPALKGHQFSDVGWQDHAGGHGVGLWDWGLAWLTFQIFRG